MTHLESPKSIKHFHSICDACQALTSAHHSPSELRLYADGYLHALYNCSQLERKEMEKLERIIDRWILDPSSFIGPDGDINNLYYKKEHRF